LTVMRVGRRVLIAPRALQDYLNSQKSTGRELSNER